MCHPNVYSLLIEQIRKVPIIALYVSGMCHSLYSEAFGNNHSMKWSSKLKHLSYGFDWWILIRMGIIALLLFVIAIGTLFA